MLTEEDFTVEEFPEEFMPPPMRDDFVIRDEMPQNNLIQDKGKLGAAGAVFLPLHCCVLNQTINLRT